MKIFIQVILFIAIICNSFHSVWKEQNQKIVTWTGNIGYPEHHHYWYLFNHKCQFFLYLSIPLYLLFYKLDGGYKLAARNSIILYITLSFWELFYYQMWGAFRTDVEMVIQFSILMGGFLVGSVFLLIYNKAWK